jgi:hypothetical protein
VLFIFLFTYIILLKRVFVGFFVMEWRFIMGHYDAPLAPSPSTPITRNTTPTLNISSDKSTFPTPPTTSSPVVDQSSRILYRSKEGIDQYSKPLDIDPLATTKQKSSLPLLPTISSSSSPTAPQNTATTQTLQPHTTLPQQFFQGRPVDTNLHPPLTTLRASTSSFDPNPTTSAPSSTPPWDTSNRDAYFYLKNPRDYTNKQPKPRPDLMFSNTWTHARFDLDRIEDVLDLETGLFLPWDAPCPDYGRIRCFAIRLPSLHLIKDYFLSSFNSGHGWKKLRWQELPKVKRPWHKKSKI